MFKNIKILPSGEKRKDHLDSVPTNDQLMVKKNEERVYKNMVDRAITPITFFDMKDKHQGYYISSIMSLPLEISGTDNFDIYRNQNIETILNSGELWNLNRHNNHIQSTNVYGLIIESLLANFQVFAYNAPTLDLMNINGNIRNDIYTKFGYAVYNNVNECMKDLKYYLENTYKLNIYSINDVSEDTMEIDSNKLNRTITMLTAISNQVNEIVTYIVCAFVSYYLYTFISDLTDEQFTIVSSVIKAKYNINENLSLDDRVSLRSFLAEALRADIKTILTNNIIPAITHICDNAGITTFFVYKDMIDNKYNEN